MIHTINSNMYLEGGNRGEFSTNYCQQKKVDYYHKIQTKFFVKTILNELQFFTLSEYTSYTIY